MAKLNLKVIKLDPTRFKEFKDLRLSALRNDPLAFGISFEEENKRSNFDLKSDLVESLKKNGQAVWLFAEVEGCLVGLGQIKFAKREKFSHIARLSGIYVEKKYRGRGIGKDLVKATIQEVIARPDIVKIKLVVNTTQKVAVSLYSTFGFKIVAKLKKEFNINGQFYDAFLMELHRSD